LFSICDIGNPHGDLKAKPFVLDCRALTLEQALPRIKRDAMKARPPFTFAGEKPAVSDAAYVDQL